GRQLVVLVLAVGLRRACCRLRVGGALQGAEVFGELFALRAFGRQGLAQLVGLVLGCGEVAIVAAALGVRRRRGLFFQARQLGFGLLAALVLVRERGAQRRDEGFVLGGRRPF